MNQIRNLSSPIDVPSQIALVKECAKVSLADDKALHLFGLVGLATDALFSKLASVWVSAYPEARPIWFEYCCEQIAEAGADKLPSIRPIGVKEVGGDAEFIPVVTKFEEPATGA